jgi:hypothetical protein
MGAGASCHAGKKQGKEIFMKKIVLLATFVFLAGCGGNSIIVKEFDSAHIRPCRDLQQLENVSDLRNYAGYLDKGDTFPLELDIENDILGVGQKSIDIVMKKKLYFSVKLPDNPTKEELERIEKLDFDSMSQAEQEEFFQRYMLYVSQDALHWAPMYDGKALKQVLGIKSGTFSFGIGMTPKEGLKSVLAIKTQK